MIIELAYDLKQRIKFDPILGLVSVDGRTGWRNGNGYFRIQIDHHKYYVHRLMWFLVHGKWPEGEIDHINGNRADNRIANLREATSAQNKANTSKRKNNLSGFKGVAWAPHARRWRAQATISGKRYHLGYFINREQAHAAYCRVMRENFGKFLRAS